MIPKISVAMATYNGAQYLQEQLQSIASQTLLPNELVIFDDSSKDNTVRQLQEFKNSVSFEVRINRNQSNLGSTLNFERAIADCTGDLIFLCDQDDIWLLDKISTIVETFAKYPSAGFVFSNAQFIDTEGKLLGEDLWSTLQGRNALFRKNTGSLFAVMINGNVVTGATMAFRSHLRPLFLPIPFNWIHDAWIAMIASASGWEGIGVEEPLVKYRRHPAQQIGASTDSLTRKVRSWAANDSDQQVKWKQLLEILDSRLEEIQRSSELDLSPSLTLLRQKILHIRNRITIRSSRGIIRFTSLLSELNSGNYQRFSSSWLSAFKDIIC
jgi:glycosyltransferase involved in cell wall biosynthesis